MPNNIKQRNCFVCGESHMKLHKIPKEEERVKIWMQLLHRNDLLKLGYSYLQNSAKICKRHFADWAFTDTSKSRLIRFALPETDAPPSGLLSSPPPCQQTPRTNMQMTLPHKKEVSVQEPSPAPSLTSTPKQSTTLLTIPNQRSTASQTILNQRSTTSQTILNQRSTTSQTILNQRSTISRLKKKIEKLKTEKLNLIRILKDNLKVDQHEFVMSQIRQCENGKNGRRWSKKDKAFAHNIYLQSPSAYRMLRDKLCFPSKSTLKRFSRKVPIQHCVSAV